VHLRIHGKPGVDFFAMVDAARLRGAERRAAAEVRKYRLCSHFYPEVRGQALQMATSSAALALVDASMAAGGATSLSGSRAAASGSG
jgi:hypothetical protein